MKRYERFFKEKRIKLYHAVRSEDQLNFVLKNGLKPDNHGFIYLSKYPLDNPRFKYVFEVNLPKDDRIFTFEEIWGEGDDEHEDDPKNPYFISDEAIPVKFLKRIK